MALIASLSRLISTEVVYLFKVKSFLKRAIEVILYRILIQNIIKHIIRRIAVNVSAPVIKEPSYIKKVSSCTSEYKVMPMPTTFCLGLYSVPWEQRKGCG